MNRVCVVVSLAIVLSAASVRTVAGPLDPPKGPVDSTMKTLDEIEPRVRLSQETTPGSATSRFLISEPGSYYLASSFTLEPGESAGITINAPGVTLDLMGHTITGVGDPIATGVLIATTARGALVTNGFVRSLLIGVGWGANAVVRDVRADDCTRGFGPSLESATGSHAVLLESCVATGGDFGFQLEAAGTTAGNGTVTARNCLASGARVGFGTDNARLEGCVSEGNIEFGFKSLRGSAVFEGCIARRNQLEGFKLGVDPETEDVAEEYVVINSMATENGGHGIIAGRPVTIIGTTLSKNRLRGALLMEGGSVIDSTITKNGADDGDDGAGLESRGDTLVRDSRVNENRGDGILLSSSGTVESTQATGNGRDGFRVTSGDVNLVACTARSNNAAGFTIDGARVRITDCTATDNGSRGMTFTPLADQAVARGNFIEGNTGFDVSIGGADTVFLRNIVGNQILTLDAAATFTGTFVARADMATLEANPWANILLEPLIPVP